jgi:ABC-type uncharacterized transport system fused permease/ATPase subunit
VDRILAAKQMIHETTRITRTRTDGDDNMKKLALSILLLALLTCSVAATTRLPFTNDDYNKALTLAKQRKLPLFVEVWAPW